MPTLCLICYSFLNWFIWVFTPLNSRKWGGNRRGINEWKVKSKFSMNIELKCNIHLHSREMHPPNILHILQMVLYAHFVVTVMAQICTNYSLPSHLLLCAKTKASNCAHALISPYPAWWSESAVVSNHWDRPVTCWSYHSYLYLLRRYLSNCQPFLASKSIWVFCFFFVLEDI